jgi:Ca2+-binding RTX toxin-like protein
MSARARIVAIAIAAVLAATAMEGITSANTVPASKLGSSLTAAGADAIKPSSCSAIVLTAVFVGSGFFSATNASELVLGGSANDGITGSGGNDCVLGGGGNDTLSGGAGADVCIGGLGTDSFASDCETQIQ